MRECTKGRRLMLSVAVRASASNDRTVDSMADVGLKAMGTGSARGAHGTGRPTTVSYRTRPTSSVISDIRTMFPLCPATCPSATSLGTEATMRPGKCDTYADAADTLLFIRTVCAPLSFLVCPFDGGSHAPHRTQQRSVV